MDILQQSSNYNTDQYIEKKRNLGDYIFGIFSIIVILIESGFALTTSMYTLGSILGGVYIVLMLIHTRYIHKSRKLVFLCGIVIFMAISIVASLDMDGIYEATRVLIVVTCAYVVTEAYPFYDIVKAFCRIMRISSIVSVLFFYGISTGILSNAPILTDGRNVEYYTCIIANIQKTDPLRNSGLFWEGGMLAAFCALWMICEILFIDQVKWKRNLFVILGCVTINTTLSTSGYLYIILILLLLIGYGAFRERKLWQQVLFVVGVIVVICIFYHFEDVIDYLVQYNTVSFQKIITRNASFTDRMNGPVTDLYLSIQHPLGIGFSRLVETVEATAEKLFQKTLTARTSTLTYFFPAFGLLGGVFVNAQWVTFFSRCNSSKIVCVLAGITFAILCTSTPLYSNGFFWIILFIGADSYAEFNDLLIDDYK